MYTWSYRYEKAHAGRKGIAEFIRLLKILESSFQVAPVTGPPEIWSPLQEGWIEINLDASSFKDLKAALDVRGQVILIGGCLALYRRLNSERFVGGWRRAGG